MHQHRAVLDCLALFLGLPRACNVTFNDDRQVRQMAVSLLRICHNSVQSTLIHPPTTVGQIVGFQMEPGWQCVTGSDAMASGVLQHLLGANTGLTWQQQLVQKEPAANPPPQESPCVAGLHADRLAPARGGAHSHAHSS